MTLMSTNSKSQSAHGFSSSKAVSSKGSTDSLNILKRNVSEKYNFAAATTRVIANAD